MIFVVLLLCVCVCVVVCVGGVVSFVNSYGVVHVVVVCRIVTNVRACVVGVVGVVL